MIGEREVDMRENPNGDWDVRHIWKKKKMVYRKLPRRLYCCPNCRTILEEKPNGKLKDSGYEQPVYICPQCTCTCR